ERIHAGLVAGGLGSVVGPTGSGVTQLALQAARGAAEDGREVHRVASGTPDAVATTLARGLGVRKSGRKTADVLADVGKQLAARDDLVVYFDAPAEGPSVRRIVAGWLESELRSAVLVASRGPLDLPGEQVVRLGALALDQAVRLFRERVLEVRGTEVDLDVATAIASRLDRMPGALEAAAAQTAFLAPEQLLRQLEQDQALGEADGLDATLAATIERLDGIERSALEQCVVFREGFDLTAAESVVFLPDRGRGMITVIESLCDRSLLEPMSGADTANVRWNLYETVRSFVRRGLSGDRIAAVQERHAATYGALGARLGGRAWAERKGITALVRERENFRAALQFGGPTAAGAALGLTALLGREPAAPLAEAIERLLADPRLAAPGQGVWRAAARLASARVQLYLGQPSRAVSDLRAVVAEEVALDPQWLIDVARMHSELGSTFEVEATLGRTTTDDPWALAVVAILRGRALAALGDGKRAERAFVEALHGFSSLGADIGAAHTQRHFAEMLTTSGQGRRAVALLRQAMEVFDDVGDTMNSVQCRMRLGELLVAVGASDEAGAHLERVSEAARELSAHGLLAAARGALGVVRTIERRWEEAEQLFVLALAGAPNKRIHALFGLHLMLKGDADTAHEEAKAALPDPVAEALVAVLERQHAPHGDAYPLWELLEAWRAMASLGRFEASLGDRASIAARMVLACPRERTRRAAP
ncbi:MAG: hypothetical protein ABMA64_40770, partial [Myxococcota bacterium]